MTMRLAKAHVHFIGIGGIGMCGLAELLHNLGAQVTGSDASENAHTLRLKSLGVPVLKGHDAQNLEGAEVVVYSSAIKPDNAEYREARRRKIPLIRRAEALAGLMNLKRGVAIAGTHGKTTTTSLVASIFLHERLDPTIIVGGRLDVIKSTAQLGQGEWLIAEADESDGSFTHLSPEVVIITNIDNDHMDHYKTIENLESAFMDFASRIPFYGVAIVCGDDVRIRKLFSDFGKQWISYGVNSDNDYILRRETDHWSVHHEGSQVGELRPAMPGEHNALNALAALLASQQAGVPFASAAQAISEFGGVDRRFQHKASVRGIDFYDDYGHHPTEIRAVLNGFKEKYPQRRLITIFQPHRYSRTQSCWSDFKTCFAGTERLFVMDIYPAGESPIYGITSQDLVAQMDHTQAQYLSRQSDPQWKTVRDLLRSGDIVLTLGAGDISKIGDQFAVDFAKV
jgi:UDP-N-acetylmuramate--alanine ligase